MKKILLIAHEFYPVNSGGSHRPFRMANHLHQNGFDVTVVSAVDEDLESKLDDSLKLKVTRSGINQLLVPIGEPDWYTNVSKSYYFNVKDDVFRRWSEKVMDEIDQLMADQIDLIIVTAPPFSVTDFVAKLKSKYDLPIFLDLRDAWSQWNVFPYASRFHYLRTLKSERKVLQLADMILLTSLQTMKDLKQLHPQVSASKFAYTPNSFDDFEVPKPLGIQETINIGYVGSFYYTPASEMTMNRPWYKKPLKHWFQYTPLVEYWKYRSPYYFFQLLNRLFKKYPAYREKVKLHFAGQTPEWLPGMLEEHSLSDLAIHHGFLTKSEVVVFNSQQHFLLITSSKREGGKDYSIAGKTFDYFAIQKPILAFVPEGAQKDILAPYKGAIILDPDHLETSVERFRDAIENYHSLSPNMDYLSDYKTEKVLGRLIDQINQVLDQKV